MSHRTQCHRNASLARSKCHLGRKETNDDDCDDDDDDDDDDDADDDDVCGCGGKTACTYMLT